MKLFNSPGDFHILRREGIIGIVFALVSKYVRERLGRHLGR